MFHKAREPGQSRSSPALLLPGPPVQPLSPSARARGSPPCGSDCSGFPELVLFGGAAARSPTFPLARCVFLPRGRLQVHLCTGSTFPCSVVLWVILLGFW